MKHSAFAFHRLSSPLKALSFLAIMSVTHACSGGGSVKGSSSSSSSAVKAQTTNAPASLGHITLTQVPATTTAGSTFSPSPIVTLYDTSNAAMTTDTASTTALTGYPQTNCGGSAIFSPFGTFTQAEAAGVITLSSFSITSTQVLSIQAIVGTKTACANITVNPGALNSIILSQVPTSTTSGTVISPSPIVTLYDANSNVRTGDSTTTTTIAAYGALNCGGGTLSSVLSAFTQSTASGVITTSSFSINSTSVLSIKATAGGFTSCQNISVSAGNLDHISIANVPAATTAGSNFSPAPVITLYDVSNNILTTDTTSTVSFIAYNAIACGGGSVASAFSAFTQSETAGVITTGSFAIKSTAVKSIQASVGGKTTCTNINVSPSTIDHVSMTNLPATTTAGTTISPSPVVTMYDVYNNILTTDSMHTVAFLAYDTIACGGLTVSSAFSAYTQGTSLGVITTASFAINSTAVKSIKATANGVSTCGNITVSAGAIDHISFANVPASITAGVTFSPSPTLTLYDINNNILSSDTTSIVSLNGYTVAGCGGAASASPFSAYTQSETAGVITAASFAINSAPIRSIKASVSGITTCANITVNPGALNNITLVNVPATTTAGATFSPSPIVTLYDSLNNVLVNDSSHTTSFTAYDTIGCAGSLVASSLSAFTQSESAGVITTASFAITSTSVKSIKATVTGGGTACSNVSVNAGSVDHITLSNVPASTTAGTTLSPSPVITLYDVNNNILSSDSSSTVAFTAYDTTLCGGSLVGSAFSAFTQSESAGVITTASFAINSAPVRAIMATVSGKTACSNVTVSPGALNSIVLANVPATATTNVNFSPAPTVTLYDSLNNVLTNDSASTVSFIGYSSTACSTSLGSVFSAFTQSTSTGVITTASFAVTSASVLSIKATVNGVTTCANVAVGAAASPNLTISAPDNILGTVAFGNVSQGAFSTWELFTFNNTGTAAGASCYAVITGTTFDIGTNTCGTSLSKVPMAASGSCSIQVRAHPASNATVNSSNNGTVSMTCSNATSPSLSMTATVKASATVGYVGADSGTAVYSAFGSVLVGATSSNLLKIDLFNGGTAVSGCNFPGSVTLSDSVNFTVVSNAIPNTALNLNTTYGPVIIAATPKSTGSFSTTVSLTCTNGGTYVYNGGSVTMTGTAPFLTGSSSSTTVAVASPYNVSYPATTIGSWTSWMYVWVYNPTTTVFTCTVAASNFGGPALATGKTHPFANIAVGMATTATQNSWRVDISPTYTAGYTAGTYTADITFTCDHSITIVEHASAALN